MKVRDLTSVAVFIEVAERGSFSTAARHLNQSPSAVSKHVGRLETQLGLRLINRSTHRLHLTEAGRLFLTKAQKILDEIDSMVSELQSADGAEHGGTLRVHITPGAAKRIVLPFVYRFMAQHPSIRIDLTITSDVVDLLSGGYDLTIRSRSGSFDFDVDQHTIEAIRLAPAEYRIGASPAFFDKYGIPEVPLDLAKFRCLIYRPQRFASEWSFIESERRYSVPVDSYLVSNDWSTIYEAATEGLGIVRILSPHSGSPVADDPLKYIFTGLIDSDVAIWAFHPRANPVPRKTQALIESLQAQMGG